MTEEKNECVPRLRFPEFVGKKWQIFSLGEVAIFYNGRAYKKEELLANGKYKILRVGNLFSNENWYYSNLELEEEKYCNYNDLLYAWSASFGPFIWHSEKTIYHYHIWKIIPNNKIEKMFLYYILVLETEKIKNNMLNGLGIMHVTKSSIESWNSQIPTLPEQQKIADCLSSLDELIEAREQKCNALKQHKKGLMQRLFPAEGETTPRWRFPEFRDSGEWCKELLGNLASVAMCKRIFSNETNTDGGVPFYKIGTLGKEPDAFISHALFQSYKNKYSYPKKGEILLTCSGTIGKIVRYTGEDAYYQDSNIVWLKNNQNTILNDFLFYFFTNFNWTNLNTTTIVRIYGDDLRNIVIPFPTQKNEQQKIADCLSSLDDRIAAEEERLTALREHKKGLMQQLFPRYE